MRVKGLLLGGLLLSLTAVSAFLYKKYFEDPYVTLVGPIEMADGIGRQAAELGSILMKDFKVNILAHHYDKEDVSSSIRKLMWKRNKRLGKIVIFEQSLWDPAGKPSKALSKVQHEGQIRIAYSMLEATRIPQEWVMQLNLYYDAVAVPDAFLVDAYKSSGVKIPVFELPLGLNLQPYLKQPLKKGRNPVMLFSNLSTAIDRKNHVTLIQAFAKALGNVEDAVLHINARGVDQATKAAIEKEIVKQNCSNIHYTEIRLRNDAYLEFFKTIDCYVSLSKGEGFSIQPREAMALGIPVIAANNTAQTTICNSGLVTAVTSSLLEPAYFFKKKIPSGHYFNCNVDEAASALLDVYNNYDVHLEKGAKARAWSSFYDYSSGNLPKLYKSLISPKKIILGSKNELHEDYIETDSKELYEKYLKVAAFSN
jgi:glycosyltransferase involved in cell wall biosynthesis